MDKKFIVLEEALVNQLLNYLAERTWKEVAHLIQNLTKQALENKPEVLRMVAENPAANEAEEKMTAA